MPHPFLITKVGISSKFTLPGRALALNEEDSKLDSWYIQVRLEIFHLNREESLPISTDNTLATKLLSSYTSGIPFGSQLP